MAKEIKIINKYKVVRLQNGYKYTQTYRRAEKKRERPEHIGMHDAELAWQREERKSVQFF